MEAAYHRERLVRWGPRTLDIDVIDYDGMISLVFQDVYLFDGTI